MIDMDTLLIKHSDNYRFHGVQTATLEELIAQSENGQIRLWGTEDDEHVNFDFDYEADNGYVRGKGFLYVTNISDIEMSYQEFCGMCGDGMVLVLERVVGGFEFDHPTDRRQHIIKVEEWKVVGGLRPVFDEDEELVDQEAFSLEEIIGVSTERAMF